MKGRSSRGVANGFWCRNADAWAREEGKRLKSLHALETFCIITQRNRRASTADREIGNSTVTP